MIVTLAVIVVLIVINALYVAAEFAAVSVRRSRIQQQAEDGDRLARMLLPTLEDSHRLDHYIAACQIGITLSSLILGAYGQAALQPVIAPLFQRLGGMQPVAAVSASATVILLALTGLQMVLGELIPKSVALQFPTAVARYTVLPMQWSLRLLSWFIVVLNGSGVAILRLLGFQDTGHRHIHQPEEIDYLIAESRKGGLLEPDEHLRLRRALHLGVTQVEEIMVPRVRIQGVEIDTPFDELVRIAAESPYTRLPVYEESLDRIVGMLHIRELAVQALDGKADARELMRPIPFIPEGLSAERALERLREGRQYMAVVVDEFGGTAGLVTLGDILDEIFGGLADEFKHEERQPERLPDGRVRLPGAMRRDEVEPWIGTEWEGEAHTVGGLIVERLGYVPDPGERIVIDGVPVEIERVRRTVLDSIVVGPFEEEAEGSEEER